MSQHGQAFPQYRIPISGHGFLAPTKGWSYVASEYYDALIPLLHALYEESGKVAVVRKGELSGLTPCLFLYRHLVEVSLKAIFHENGVGDRELKAKFEHSLADAWRSLRARLQRAPIPGEKPPPEDAIAVSDSINRYKERAGEIEGAILELDAVDPDGSAFRYPSGAALPRYYDLVGLHNNANGFLGYLLGVSSSVRFHRKMEHDIGKAIRGAFMRLDAEEQARESETEDDKQ